MAPPKKRKPAPVGVASVQRSNTPLIIGVITLVVLLAVAAVVIAVVQNKSDHDDASTETLAQWQPVTVTGTALSAQPDTGTADPAVGTAVPELSGKTFNGTEVNITNDGHAKVIMFFAHWCPHCRKEAPLLSDWIKAHKTDHDVDFYAVATGTSAQSANYPPSSWFDSMSFPTPVLADDHAAPAAGAFGLSSYPYLVFVGKDGKLISRTSGEISMDDFGQYVAATAGTAGAPATDSGAASKSSPATSEVPTTAAG